MQLFPADSIELFVLVHVAFFSVVGSLASRNLTGWEWLGIPLLVDFFF